MARRHALLGVAHSEHADVFDVGAVGQDLREREGFSPNEVVYTPADNGRVGRKTGKAADGAQTLVLVLVESGRSERSMLHSREAKQKHGLGGLAANRACKCHLWRALFSPGVHQTIRDGAAGVVGPVAHVLGRQRESRGRDGALAL